MTKAIKPHSRYLIAVNGTVSHYPTPVSMEIIHDLLQAQAFDAVVLTRVGGRPDQVMIVDDLGCSKNLPVNPEATKLYHDVCVPGTTHEIRGPVFVCPDSDFGGQA